MSFRATYYYRAQAAVWAFLAFLQIYPNAIRYHLQSPLILGLIVAGAIAGGGLGAGLSHRWLSQLQKTGAIRTSLSTLLILVGAIIVVASVLLLFGPNVPLVVLASTLAFIAPMDASSFAVTSVMFSDWERRNGRRIFTIMWPGGFYVTPGINSEQNR